jgi:ATP adenylyltransferase
MDHLWSPWRFRYLAETPKAAGCVFCVIAASAEDEANLVVYRGQFNFVVLNRYPYTTGHVMVIPYEHAASLAEIPEATATEMMGLIRVTEGLIRQVYRPDGINIGMNIGESAGAGVAGHIHMHVLGRWSGDANFMTTIGETRVMPEELGQTWQRLTQAFAAWRESSHEAR